MRYRVALDFQGTSRHPAHTGKRSVSWLLQLAMPFGAGFVLGTVFFGGLWWTVRKGLHAANPALWFGLSALLRMGVLLLGLYAFTLEGLTSLLACTLGIVITRIAAAWLTPDLPERRSCT
jgi:F1F0 ATPase subunit 2